MHLFTPKHFCSNLLDANVKAAEIAALQKAALRMDTRVAHKTYSNSFFLISCCLCCLGRHCVSQPFSWQRLLQPSFYRKMRICFGLCMPLVQRTYCALFGRHSILYIHLFGCSAGLPLLWLEPCLLAKVHYIGLWPRHSTQEAVHLL